MPKFVLWVPTMSEFINGFFELAPVSSSDVVYDLGSGDGRLLFAALEKGAGKCVGIDIDSKKVNEARELAREKGLDSKVTFIEGDFLDHDLSEATVILCYLFPEALRALRPKFELELKPGTRIVSEVFTVPKWKEAKVREVNRKNFNLYIMPPEKED
ncbi:MAG TPA: methyltransferase domain-containing protein [Dehalococcoidia bacterium]|nr:methyltransferase domain-containing protein [Dehalococcoidia bacterium]